MKTLLQREAGWSVGARLVEQGLVKEARWPGFAAGCSVNQQSLHVSRQEIAVAAGPRRCRRVGRLYVKRDPGSNLCRVQPGVARRYAPGCYLLFAPSWD